MKERDIWKSIWRDQLPYSLFWLIVAIIAFVKSGTLWGGALLLASLAFTIALAYVGKLKAKRLAENQPVADNTKNTH